MKDKKYVEQGTKLKALINSKGFSPYSFSMATLYGTARVYRLCSGEDSVCSLSLSTVVRFCKVLDIKSIDVFYEMLGIDLFNEVN